MGRNMDRLDGKEALDVAPEGFTSETGSLMADAVLDVLRKHGGALTRTGILRGVFRGHVSGPQLGDALELLVAQGRVVASDVRTGRRGRPATRYALASREEGHEPLD